MAEQPKTTTAAHCEWRLTDPDFGTWETSCGNAFVITGGSPTQNNMRFCCYCGLPLKKIPHADSSHRAMKGEITPELLRRFYRNAQMQMTYNELRRQRISWVVEETGATREEVEAALEALNHI